MDEQNKEKKPTTTRTIVASSNAGRPTKMTPEVLQKLHNAFLMGCNDEEACFTAKIDVATFWRYKQKHPEYCKEIEALKLNPKIKAKATLYKNLEDPKIAAWYLERRAKEEFSLRTETVTPEIEEEQTREIITVRSIIEEIRNDVKSTNSQPN